MQTKHLILGAAAVSLALTGFSTASFAAKHGKHGNRDGARMIERLDTNKDAKVSPDEFKTNVSATFKAYDADGNGEVTKAEIKAKRDAFHEARKAWHEARKTEGDTKTQALEKLRAERPGMLPGVGKMFDQADADKNGTLSATEVANAADAVFKRRDKGDDGFLDAADFGGKGHGDRHGKREQRAERMLQRLDLNKDGKISQEELVQKAALTFDQFDTNKDSQVSKDELKAKREAFHEARKAWREVKASEGEGRTEAREKLREARVGMLPGAGKMFERADTDKSGSLSKQEVASAAGEIFKRRDKNADGFIDAADFGKK
ncbi:EF-hand domain-containing protein [Pararhizobium sp.]|uniref:EF-hand domain-containing protein n=1 Tax=Pararhizobium sp. TaxID=1977563 RepID=UPI002723ECE4|nr:EF-hand domain-containing protein [Pararhizobium sp.]MDO9417777.1 EF-hand domain-containing protein [Pararhizobium sp.]